MPTTTPPGPYGDPDIAINVQQGLAKLRQPWIHARGDTENLPCAVPITSAAGR
ncbi:hypothetical protein ACNKHM_10525 [Shigella sonnei]